MMKRLGLILAILTAIAFIPAAYFVKGILKGAPISDAASSAAGAVALPPQASDTHVPQRQTQIPSKFTSHCCR